MEETYTQAIDIRQYKRSGTHLNLLVVSKKEGLSEIPLGEFHKDRIFVGRNASKCGIALDSKIVSSVHAKIKIENGAIYFADLGSTNGTYIMRSGSYVRMKENRYVGPLKEGMMFLLGGKGKKINDPENEAILFIVISADNANSWKKYPLFDEEYVIGKDKDCDIVFNHPAVSHHHARVYKRGHQFFVEDLNSTNGVFVNGVAVRGTKEINEKDTIQIGLQLIVFSCETLICKTETEGIQLTMCDLVKKVDGGKKTILSDVNCTIESNEFVAIVGGSGAGKSTLLKTLGGYDKFYEGDVFYNGISLKRHYNVLKNIIGYVPQEDIVFENLTLKKMLYYTAKMKMPDNTSMQEIEDRIQEVLRLIELTEHQNTMIKNLSGGQKKRASIAVELLADPGMFFLDEPTSGLDPGTEQKLMRVLNRLSKTQGKTICKSNMLSCKWKLDRKNILIGVRA